MSRSMLNLLAVLTLNLMSLPFVPAETITWTGNSGNESWHTPGNWDLNRQPVDGDDVVIPAVTGTLSVIYSTGTVNLNSLTSHEHIRLTNGTLNLASTSQINEAFTQSGGTLGGAGNLTINGLLTWTGGTMHGGGITNANGGIHFTNSFGNNLQLTDRILNNAGTANWTGAGLIFGSPTGIFNNLNGATFNIRSDSAWISGTINNFGAIERFGTNGETTIGAVFNNQNQVNVIQGVLKLTGGGTSNGDFSVGTGGALNFNNGTFILNAETSFAGSLIQLTGGTLNVVSDIHAENFQMLGGTLTGPATFTIDGFLLWEGGAMRGTGTTQLNGEAVVRGANTKQLLDTRTFNNAGQISWEGTGNFVNTVAATFNNQTGATLAIQTEADWLGGTFNNNGQVNKLSAGETQFSATFNQNNEVNIDVGTITFTGPGASAGVFDIDTGAVFSLASTNYTFNVGTSLIGAGTTRLTNGSLNVAANTDVNHFEMTGGTLTGNAELKINVSFTWSGGIMRGAGKTRLDGTGIFTGALTKQLLDTRIFDNAGTITWTGTGNLSHSETAIFNNLSGAALNIQTDADWFNGTFNNAGTITKSVTTGETQFTAVVNNNNSQVNLQTGLLNFRSGGGNDNVTYDVSAGATVRFSGGTCHFNAGSDFDGAGIVDFAGGINHVNASFSHSGHTIISVGTTNINDHVTLNTLTLSSGAMGGNGEVDLDGLFTWSGGTMQDNGITNANGDVNIIGANPKNIAHNRIFNNAGTAVWTGLGNVGVNPTATFNNQPGAIFGIQTDADWFNGTFINNGTVIKSGAGDTQISATFTNHETLIIEAGTLSLSGNFTNFANNTLTGGRYRVASNFRFINADIVNNAADIELIGPSSRIIDYQFTPNDALRNFSVNTEFGSFHIRDGRDFSPEVPLSNSGTVIVGEGSELSFSEEDRYTKTETGRLILRNGTFAPSNFYIQTSGLTGGVGAVHTFTYRTTLEADMSPGESPGEIVIQGNYIHDGRLIIELGDPDEGEFDALHCAGHVTLNGTLLIAEMPNYAPQVGDTYTVLTYGSRTGSFNHIVGRTLNSGLVVYQRFFEERLDLIVSYQGDVNLNGCVDDSDLLAVLFAFAQTGTLPEDLTGDGVVDDADLLAVLFNFGNGC